MKTSRQIFRLSWFACLVPGILVMAVPLNAQPSAAEPRIALIMGVGDYQGPRFRPLPGIDSDLQRMESALKATGFETTVVINPSLTAAEEAIDTFGARLKAQPGAVGLFYFSGHGGEFEGRNFLIPKDARISSDRDIKEQAMAAQRVLNRMEDAGSRVSIVFLDCCRNDLTKAASATGLAAMSAKGTFIGFATGTDRTSAASAEGSPYTAFLAKRMLMPGISILDMHTQVTADVEDFAKARGMPDQTPFQYSGLRSNFAFLPGSQTLPAPPAVTQPLVNPPIRPNDVGSSKPAPPAAEKGDARAFTRISTRNYPTSSVAELEAVVQGGKRIPLAAKQIIASTQFKEGPLTLVQKVMTDANGIIRIPKPVSKSTPQNTYLVFQFAGDEENRPCQVRFKIK